MQLSSNIDPDVKAHVLLLFEKMRLKIRTESHFGITDYGIHDFSERLLTSGHFHPESLSEEELPIPYVRIYEEELSDKHYFLAFPNFEFFHFPKLFPIGRFCLEVDLMPFN
jgi:hypothetical protein